MQPSIAEDRPPYITFGVKAEEDRAASIAAGGYRAKDVHYVYITPQGSKDRIERVVADWFAHLRAEVKQQRFREDWLDKYEKAYERWKAGQENPLEGTSVKNWPVLSPSQVLLLQELHVLTIEDMARANEETIGRIGMGGRALKQQAETWLESQNSSGKISQEMSRLVVENEALKASNELLAANLAQLNATVKALQDSLQPQGQARPQPAGATLAPRAARL